jgi:hypothetical protein
VFVLVSALWVAPAAPASISIRPGTYMATRNSGCTFSFVYDGTDFLDGNVYIGTAAHCVSRLGEDVAISNGTPVGDVAMMGSAKSASTDWALVKIRPEYVQYVHPSVIGHSKAPTGYAKSSHAGDQVYFSGYGIPFDHTPQTRQNRTGVMVSQGKTRYTLIGMDSWGDSGGPIILANNLAMGIVSRLCENDPCTSEGPTVSGILGQVQAWGLTVTLRTV